MLEREKSRLTQPTSRSTTEQLLDFIPRITPRWQRPDHLAPVARLFERAMSGEEVNACVSVPPQHGKTETILHGIAWWLRHRPQDLIGYVSYSADLARSKSRLARDYAREAGVELRDDSTALHEWRTKAGGGLLAGGVDGPLTGHGLRLLIVDDPHKNRADAESKRQRDTVEDWLTSTGTTRMHPGSSRIVVHTRWHLDDLIGRLTAPGREDAWEYIELPAIDTQGRALWEAKRPREWLDRQRVRVGAYDWSSLYQCRPVARGAEVFQGVTHYEERPPALRVAIGVDLAYTARTRADRSAAVVLAEYDDAYYVLDVHVAQVQAPDFALTLRSLASRYPGARMPWYASGTEKGSADFLLRQGVPLVVVPPKGDKFVRAQPVAAAWNAGNVRVPVEAPWVLDMLDELHAFTGSGDDARDDIVDALAAAYDSLAAGGGRVEGVGRKRDAASLRGIY